MSTDAEMDAIVGEEVKVLDRVTEQLGAVTQRYSRDYDGEMLELRDVIAEARTEDLPALMAEMERLREISSRRADVPTGNIDRDNPYFGHLKLEEGTRVRDVLIGNATYVDTDQGLRVVDWRDAPVSRLYYRYAEGDEYEEEFGGRMLEGVVRLRRAVVIRDGVLRRVMAPQGVFVRGRDGWTRGQVSAAKLAGGQMVAVRPPTEDERRSVRGRKTGRLGVGADGREDRHLPEIPALIDPRQFELMTRGSSGLVVIQGGAGSGKTTIGLHRMAYLAFNNPRRFVPDRMLVVVFNRALASYIARVLPGLGVEGVSVQTFADWVAKQRTRHVARTPEAYTDDTPPVVSRLKKHPVMLRVIDARVKRETVAIEVALRAASVQANVEATVMGAWKALEGTPLSRRLSGVAQWLRGEREIPGVRRGALDARAVTMVGRAADRQMRRARDIVWDWAEILTDAKGLERAFTEEVPGEFSSEEIARSVRWCSEQLGRWMDHDADEDTDEAPDERKASRKTGDEERTAEEATEAVEAAEESHGARTRRDTDDDWDDTDDDRSRRTGIDGVVEAPDPATLDREDDALLVRLYQAKRGPLRGPARMPLRYEHLFVDEAQDLSPVELAVLMDVASEDKSVTLAGDTSQRLLLDNGFTDWRGVLKDLGMSAVAVEPLRIGYRSTLEVLAFAREVLGPLADPEPPVATRSGAAVEFHPFADTGAALAFLGEALRDLMIAEPRANVAVVTREPERADIYHSALVRAEVPRLTRVRDQDFTFRPGVEVTDIRQVKGLEWDYVILVDVTSHAYPINDESRHLLHIGATRAAHQLWLVAAGTPSQLIPAWMRDEG
jgi:DNA helicase-2/ATP-dependent DNA helicase PcrA